MKEQNSNIDEVTEAVTSAEDAREASNEIMALERESQAEREKLLHRLIGRVEAFGAINQFTGVGELAALKEIKDGKLYKPMTWDETCERLGKSRSHLDEQLKNLAILGPDFLETAQHLNIGYRQLRQLRYAAAEGDMVVESEFVVIDEERIPLGPDYKEDLQIALERVVEQKIKLLDELAAERKDREKLVKAETKGLKTERDALVKEVQNLQSRIPDDKDYAAWAVDEVRRLQDLVSKFNIGCTKLVVDGRLAEDRVSQGHIYGMIEAMDTTLDDLAERLGAACPRSEI